MFRRKSKLNVSLPKPPTKDEILEDMEYFSLDRMLTGKDRRQSTASNLNASLDADKDSREKDGDVQLEEWWQKFETFLTDINDLESYRKQFEYKKTNVNKLDEEISAISEDISSKLKVGIQKVTDEITENEQDLR